MIDDKGINISRRILSPATNGIGEELREMRTFHFANTFIRSVVVNVLTNPSALDSETILQLKKTVQNPDFLDKAPRNTIIARVVANGQDRKVSTSVICYPFLPSHMAMPIKAGEQVWLLFENAQTGGSLPFWLWKTSEPNHVEDANYTHADRKFDRTSQLKTSDKVSSQKNEKKIVSFPNGAGTENSYTLRGKDDYEAIISEDNSYADFVPEPVPRFTKRPGDFVVQGSNNSLIVLGEDRTYAGTLQTGAIDIVVGRGRFLSEVDQDPIGSSPRITKNSRGNLETEKNPVVVGVSENPIEGDPDLKNDSARINVSMNTNVDEILQIVSMLPKSFDGEIKSSTNSPSAFMKADNVRIVARKDDDHGIDGSVIVMKEGEESERCALLLLPGGNAILDGNLVYIGRSGGNGPGPGGTEPYIKFSKYKSQLTSIVDELKSLLNIMSIQFSVPVAAPGTPAPGLVACIPSIQSVITNLTKIETKFDEAKSTRIFGE